MVGDVWQLEGEESAMVCVVYLLDYESRYCMMSNFVAGVVWLWEMCGSDMCCVPVSVRQTRLWQVLLQLMPYTSVVQRIKWDGCGVADVCYMAMCGSSAKEKGLILSY